MDYEYMTAPCGLACFECIVYLAKESEELREMLSKRFGIPPEEIGCDGCRVIKGKVPGVPNGCRVFNCAEERGVNFCCDCSDFPCDLLHPYADKADSLPHNTKVFNLCLIKKMGLESWAKNKAKEVIQTYFHGEWKL